MCKTGLLAGLMLILGGAAQSDDPWIVYKGGDPEQVRLALEIGSGLAEGRQPEIVDELRAMLPALEAEADDVEDEEGANEAEDDVVVDQDTAEPPIGPAEDPPSDTDVTPDSQPEPASVVQPTLVAAPAMWAADPYGRHQLRWWDGERWTAHVSDNGTTSEDLL